MGLPPGARLAFIAGLAGLLLSVLNQALAPEASAPLLRAEALATLMGVGLMLVALLWTRASPLAPERVALEGALGLELAPELPEALATELAWASQMLLTATPAAVVLLHWDGATLLRRGLLQEAAFVPGAICRQAQQRQRPIGLVNLALYPGRAEFEALLQDVPAVVVEPLLDRGWLVVGGWSPRCFSRTDEAWIHGLALRLTEQVMAAVAEPAASGPPAESGSAPVPGDR